MNEEFQDIEETGAYATVTAVQDDNYDQQRLAAGKEFSQGLLEEQKEITEDTLRKDPAFAEAYKVVNKFLTNEDIEGTNEELADQGFQLASDFKNAFYTADNGLGLVGTYNKFKDAPKDVKESAWYLWNNYEEADMTWGALGRGLKSMGTDPSTYTGVAAGWSFFGKIAARSAAKKKMQDLFLGGVVGGSFTGGEEFVKQEIQDITEKDWEQIGLNTSIGAIVGVASIPAIDYSVKGIKAAGKGIANIIDEGQELMMQQAGGGTPPALNKEAEFNSVLTNALNQTSQKNWNVEQLKGYLGKQGVKTDEMKWSGIDDYLQGKTKVTTDELLANIKQPELTKKTISEVKVNKDSNFYGEDIQRLVDDSDTEEEFIIALENDYEAYNRIMSDYPDMMDNEDWAVEVADEIYSGIGQGGVQYKKWSTPDVGENYREELTTVSGEKIDAAEGKYKSSHWSDRNVLYHVRKQDTTIDNGNTLLIEEIQSDWHQDGRKKGYAETLTNEDYAKKDALRKEDIQIKNEVKKEIEKAIPNKDVEIRKLENLAGEQEDIADNIKTIVKDDYLVNSFQIAKLRRGYKETGEIPQNDYELDEQGNKLLKELFEVEKKAADFDKQILDIDKKVDEVREKLYNEKGYGDRLAEIGAEFDAYAKKGVGVPDAPYKKTWHEKAMKDQINEAINNDQDRIAWIKGKDQADRYEDESLIEGMEGFYDKMLPKWTDKYIKKYGSKVEIKELPNGQEVWSFKITDKMKETIKDKGQPLYQVGGATAVGGAAASQQKEETE